MIFDLIIEYEHSTQKERFRSSAMSSKDIKAEAIWTHRLECDYSKIGFIGKLNTEPRWLCICVLLTLF